MIDREAKVKEPENRHPYDYELQMALNQSWGRRLGGLTTQELRRKDKLEGVKLQISSDESCNPS